MAGPSRKDWRAGRESSARRIERQWLDLWRMGRAPGRSSVSDAVWHPHASRFENFGRLSLWQVSELAQLEASERMRRALAAHNETVEKPSRRKAGEMI